MDSFFGDFEFLACSCSFDSCEDRDFASQPEPRDGCSEFEVVLQLDSVPCQVRARNRALEIARSGKLRVRGVRGDSTITSQCSNVSRMEAVFVREQALKLNQHVGHIKRPTDLIRHLEDFSKSEANLSNFTEMKLSEADRCSVLLQSLSAEVRQYVVLHGSSSDWEALP